MLREELKKKLNQENDKKKKSNQKNEDQIVYKNEIKY
jgi:sRNA-binding carbon storage regulator CsrA